MTDWAKLKVADLRVELRERGLPAAGVKAELVARLANSEAEEEANAQSDQDPTPELEQSPEPEEPAQLEQPIQPEEPAQLDEHIQPEEPAQLEEPAQPEEPSVAEETLADSRDPSPLGDASTDAPVVATPQIQPQPEPEPEPEPEHEPGLEPTVASDAGALNPPPAQSTLTEQAKTNTADLRDAQKRKRRSASPPPSVHDTKRTKVDIEGPPDADIVMTDGVADAASEEREEPKPVSGNESPGKSGPSNENENEGDRDVPPAIHAATSALYIKNFMRPLHTPEFKAHLVELAAAPGTAPDEGVIVDCFLDMIRTHAFVQFRSTVAAERVRASLHDTVFPKESNRKALWVDFIPADCAQEWIDREEQEPRSSSARFEVVYDESGDEVTARLAEISITGSNSARPRGAAAAAAPAAQPPTGPRVHPGVEGAPLAPRADQQRGRGGAAFRTPRITDPNIRTTQGDPMLYWKPISDELAQRRITNMRQFYNPDARVTDDDKRNNINRYFFENGDNFVDRGKEIFAGIRPPHREREHRRMMREQRQQGGSTRMLDPTRRDRNAIPPPQSFRPSGGDRYMGSANRGDSWRESDSYSRHEERRYRDHRGRGGGRRR